MLRILVATLALATILANAGHSADGNRLAYLDGPLDPYYPHREFPKLITPQWVGEEGVECVVTLAIDDMRDSAKYEAYLRPILDRLKKIDGRAPVSIMSCRVDPKDPQLQAWLKEGLSIEVHTFDHPCPCLQDGGLVQAKETYDKCVDLMNEIPGNKPVAFRMPCCDSKNTPSPRFWAEVFNKTTAKGNFLQIDSSVFNIITKDDKDLPKEITELPDGSSRFERYVPFPNFVNTIRDYPYPYVIGGMCWEFPCVVPSDWSAQHVQKPNNPDTLRDWKLALDACVLKQGTFNLVFHPHGWIRNDQIVELIDHAVAKHGKKVTFLTFKECAERLNKNLMRHKPVRNQPSPDVLARVLDLNQDGFQDVVDFNPPPALGYVWCTDERKWAAETMRIEQRGQRADGDPLPLIGIFSPSDPFTMLLYPDRTSVVFMGAVDAMGEGFPKSAGRLLDIDRDGTTELISTEDENLRGEWAIRQRIASESKWSVSLAKLPFRGRLDHARLIDINADGKLDCLFSNQERYSLHLFKDMKEGWATKVFDVERGKDDADGAPAIPPFVRADGTNNGAFFHSGALWFVNEDTWRMPDHVQKFTFDELLAPLGRRAQAAKPGVDAGDKPKIEMPPPKPPDEALKSMHLKPGFKIELVAAEPLVVDPVAFDWGPDGRLWVVEMRDYPNGVTWKKAGDEVGVPGGRVKVLTDENGDGKYDKASVFLDKVPFPTGVKVWRKGILVTAAPDVFYAEDTNHDDVADVQKVLYRGFGEGNQQHRVNGLRWGLDNWLYIGNGDSGGVIKSLAALTPTRSVSEGSTPTRSVTEGAEVNVNGRDLRIRPDTGEIDAQSGQTQFGRERDDWGNWFGGNNSNPMWHYTLEDHYLRRNPHFAPPPNKKQVSTSPGAAPVYPKSKTLARFNDFHTADRFTSACSPIIYRDELLGPEFYGNSFVCEPVHNLVHREIVAADGTSFTSCRADEEEKSEFLASDDNWFRPSMCRTGPDGALWVSDMYRFVVEHPKWIPEEYQKTLDLRAGDDKGRIYRIYHESRPPRPIAKLDKLDTAGLVVALDSPNGPQRDLVHQMLIWQADKAAAEPLRKLAQNAERPQTRLQALCALDGLDEVAADLLSTALQDEHPGVQRHAIRLAEPHLAQSPRLAGTICNLAQSPDLHVRMQVAYSLGLLHDDRTSGALATIVETNANEPYILAAVLSSATRENTSDLLAATLAARTTDAGKDEFIEQLLSTAAGFKDKRVIHKALDRILAHDPDNTFNRWQFAALAGMLDALNRQKISLKQMLADREDRRAEIMLAQIRKTLHAMKRDPASNGLDEWCELTFPLLARGLDELDEHDIRLLRGYLDFRYSLRIQQAAVSALGKASHASAPQALLGGWSSRTPMIRDQALDVLLSQEAWSLALVEAIEQGTVPASHLDARRRQQLLAAKSENVRQRAEKAFGGAVDPNRQQVVQQYAKAVAEHPADAAHGKAVFAKRCANCHRFEGIGHSLGPDLAALTNRSREALLTAVFDPNRAVEDKFLEYVVRLTDGRQVNGMLLEETGASLTLAAPEGKQTVIPRSEVELLKSSGKSLMPEGVEKDITPAEAADLVAYLASNTPPPKELAGNKPEVVRPFVDGSIRLLATNARVYGPTVVLEEKYRNLGWWSSIEDHAVWSFDAPEGGGEYRLTLDYACDDSAAGNTVVVEVAGQSLAMKVEGTGSWDSYRGKELGIVTLPGGPGELLVRSSGPIKAALLDLRSVRLAPKK